VKTQLDVRFTLLSQIFESCGLSVRLDSGGCTLQEDDERI